MTSPDIVNRRLEAQQLSRHRFARPADLVAWFGAVQAQDFTSARWAIGQRLRGATDEAIGRACDAGTLIRTHVLRPTWHLLAAADVRWMLALAASRVKAVAAYNLRAAGIDARILSRCHGIIERSLRGGRALTRVELATALARAGVAARVRLAAPQTMGHVLFCAELDALICSGPRRGKQATYALLDERVPPSPGFAREEALAELARRYFRSHGPATVEDFNWWSGLTRADARAGVEGARAGLTRVNVDGRVYWAARGASPGHDAGVQAWLLPNFDEFAVAYVDRSLILPTVDGRPLSPRDTSSLGYSILVNGCIAGTWKRVYGRTAVTLAIRPAGPVTRELREAIDAAVERFERFAGLPVRRAT